MSDGICKVTRCTAPWTSTVRFALSTARIVPIISTFSSTAPDGIAPVGADLQDAKAEAQAQAVDLSQFSLAPVGSDMGQAKAAPPAPPPDTSHLKLQE